MTKVNPEVRTPFININFGPMRIQLLRFQLYPDMNFVPSNFQLDKFGKPPLQVLFMQIFRIFGPRLFQVFGA